MAFNNNLAAVQFRSNYSTVLIIWEFTSLSINSSFLNSVFKRWPNAQSGSALPEMFMMEKTRADFILNNLIQSRPLID